MPYLQALSLALLQLDPDASMDVSPLPDGSYELGEVRVFGKALTGTIVCIYIYLFICIYVYVCIYACICIYR